MQLDRRRRRQAAGRLTAAFDLCVTSTRRAGRPAGWLVVLRHLRDRRVVNVAGRTSGARTAGRSL
jgi:hypothetical protein